jgi:hypothetical protein
MEANLPRAVKTRLPPPLAEILPRVVRTPRPARTAARQPMAA